MKPNRAQRRTEKQKEWRNANRLYHDVETASGMKREKTTNKRRTKEKKIERWHRRRKGVSP